MRLLPATGIWMLSVLNLMACGGNDAATVPVPFRADGDYLAAWVGDRYRRLFVKGVNLGVGLPGTQPGELAPTEQDYLTWFGRMHQLGIQTVRVYTLHYPRFYRALVEFNRTHPDQPLYVLQGIWLDELDITGDLDLFASSDRFDKAISEVVDAAHGSRDIEQRFGQAFGTFDVDISPWVLGWVIGREILPSEVDTTNRSHSEISSYSGLAVSIDSGTPTEAWVAARIDYLISYEREAYGTERPVSLSSWPTLDPLNHPTEALPEASHEDSESIDLNKLDTRFAPAGVFATYHAYPYYPNFIDEDPGYLKATDESGTDNYLGYLMDLKAHYKEIPLVVGEFGVPSSWGNAHFSPSGMHHGGHDETQQGVYDARQMRNIFDAGGAGGALFAWFDEWWKRTWIVDERTMPRQRYRLWPDVTSPEQNFGLIAFDCGLPDFEQWPAVAGPARIEAITAAATPAFFHVRVELTEALAPSETLTIGFDTYADDRGESVLPGGIVAKRRNEFALVIEPPDTANLLVTEAYDLHGIWHGTASDVQQFRSTATDGARWVVVRWQNGGEHSSRDGTLTFPATDYPIGELRVRDAAGTASSLDAVVIDQQRVDVRLPWTLLQFADPSTLTVVDDDRSTPTRETTQSRGIALTVVVPGDQLETDRFRWSAWDDTPDYVAREKPSAQLFGEALKSLPSWP